jgi:hypothetical protein
MFPIGYYNYVISTLKFALQVTCSFLFDSCTA